MYNGGGISGNVGMRMCGANGSPFHPESSSGLTITVTLIFLLDHIGFMAFSCCPFKDWLQIYVKFKIL